MSSDIWLTETYFDWLRREAFDLEKERKEYEGVLRELHDIPFYWTIWADEGRAMDALTFRQSDFLSTQHDLDSLDQFWLGDWATAAPSVLEVLLGIARRWWAFFEEPIPLYFGHMFVNMGFDRFPGKVLPGVSQERIRIRCDNWLSRQFDEDGSGSPFPIHNLPEGMDCRNIDIGGQMNLYSLEHYQ